MPPAATIAIGLRITGWEIGQLPGIANVAPALVPPGAGVLTAWA